LAKKDGKLVLKDGGVYTGYFVGDAPGVGEVVFNTAMTGYQETLTDPSYCGQIVVMTYPLIGNYGVNDLYNQARKSYFRGYVVSELCRQPSNWRAEGTIEDFLRRERIPCLCGVDTRALTRRIRAEGTLWGTIVPAGTAPSEIDRLLALPEETLFVKEVTIKQPQKKGGKGKRVAFWDFGAKYAMVDALCAYGYDLTLYPAYTGADEILSGSPDGIFLSNGPGDPKALPEIVANVKEIIKSGKPIFGICLGFQLICLALGADTYKMKFGHRGVNHPVKDLQLNKVVITSQNHGYAVDEQSLKGTGLIVTHRNVNDQTLEGVAHGNKPIFAVQYHPEACPGPDGHEYLFERFCQMIGGRGNA
jgi:carbamoyl-phosphate synthase small subunit